MRRTQKVLTSPKFSEHHDMRDALLRAIAGNCHGSMDLWVNEWKMEQHVQRGGMIRDRILQACRAVLK